MGWFLKRNKKNTRKRTSQGGGRGGIRGAKPKPWDPQRTMLGLKILGAFAAVVAVAIGWRYGEQALRDYTAQAHAAAVTAEDVVLADAPPWLTVVTRDELRQVVAKWVGPDPLDGLGLRRAAGALAREPWIRQVSQVRRLAGGQVVVSAVYREPVAVVQALDGYHLVDAWGVCLPGLYYRYQVGAWALPVIVGVATAPPVAGEVWEGPDVQAGLALVRLLAGEAYAGEVKSVDVGRYDERGRRRLVLHTAQGMVRWGLPPGEEHAVEPDARVKLERLRWTAQTYGSIDAGGQVVDIFGATVQVLQSPVPGGGGLSAYTLGR